MDAAQATKSLNFTKPLKHSALRKKMFEHPPIMNNFLFGVMTTWREKSISACFVR